LSGDKRGVRTSCLAGAALAVAILVAPAQADTLREALVRTYSGNPTLTGARARLRAIDENVSIARAEGRPRLTGTAEVTQDYLGTHLRNGGRALTGGVQLDYPLFQGGRVKNGIKAADARVIAGRADLRATEGDVFTDAVGAYMDVIRDTSIVELNANQVKVLGTNLEASQQRFQVGDLTRTDVAQSEARLSLARSEYSAAQGRLTVSRENYQRLIGTAPGALEAPPPLPPLPATPEAAVQVALANNPNLSSAGAAAQAAGYDVRTANAARLPTLSAGAGSSYTNFLGTTDQRFQGSTIGNDETTSSLGLTARIPLYQGGSVAAQVRQARALENQALEQTIEAERFVIASVRGSFASYQAAREQITASEEAVSANRLALEGTRAENSVGTRTILDVLNAEQELLNSQVSLVTARRDEYVAGFALLNAMGQAEMRDLGLDGGPLYDPVSNYNRVTRSMSDWSSGPRGAPQATRTVGDAPSPVVAPVLHYDDVMK
jgi:outer membrane protein